MNDATRPASKPPMLRRVFTLLVCAVLALFAHALTPEPSHANATVTVELRDGPRPVAGTVTLTATAGGQTFTCRAAANNGTCSIANVPGGMYSVTVNLAQGPAPRPRTVMIPPSGNARVIVSAR